MRATSERIRRASTWVLCALAWAVFLTRVVVPAARTPNTNGFVAYYTEARILLEDHRELPRVYDDAWLQSRIDEFFQHHVIDIIRAQPPTMSLILAPLAWLSPAPARAIWITLSVVLWVWGLAILIDALQIKFSAFPVLPVLSALTTLYTPLADNLRRGQAYVFLYLLLCVVVRNLIRPSERRRWAAGVPLGLMIVVKTAGAWLWPLLLVGRRWRVVLAAVATAAAVALLSGPLLGWQMWRLFILDYRWLASCSDSHLAAYQTIASLTGHLFVLNPTNNPRPLANLPRLAPVLTLLITATALIGSARLQRLSSNRFEERALSIGLCASLIVSLAPLAEGYHYVLVFPSLLIGFWWELRAVARRRDLAILIGCAVLIATPQKYYGSHRLQDGWLALLAYPRLYGALVLWAWLGDALRQASMGRTWLRSAPAGPVRGEAIFASGTPKTAQTGR